jgi:hypothetical protein
MLSLIHNEDNLLLTKYYSRDEVKKNEIGRACGTHEGEERCTPGFGGET